MSQFYCFTLHIPDWSYERLVDFESKLSSVQPTKYVFQLEAGGLEGSLHLQGYFEMSSRRRVSTIVRMLGIPEIHLERRKGSAREAWDYCQKEDTRVDGPWFFGEVPRASQQGRRTDLEEIRKKLKEGQNELAIADEYFGQWVRYHKAFRRYQELLKPPRLQQVEVIVLWGEAGTGKTRWCFDRYGYDAVYAVPSDQSGQIWFDGYIGQPVMLLDDFYGWLKLHFLLKLCDRYPLKLPIKGGFAECQATTIVFTSNQEPLEWYHWDKFPARVQQAFIRRMRKIIYYSISPHTEKVVLTINKWD